MDSNNNSSAVPSVLETMAEKPASIQLFGLSPRNSTLLVWVFVMFTILVICLDLVFVCFHLWRRCRGYRAQEDSESGRSSSQVSSEEDREVQEITASFSAASLNRVQDPSITSTSRNPAFDCESDSESDFDSELPSTSQDTSRNHAKRSGGKSGRVNRVLAGCGGGELVVFTKKKLKHL